MSKERLEEIQNEVNYAYRRNGSISTKAVTMPIEHYEHLYEQAERVQELEDAIKEKALTVQMKEYIYMGPDESVSLKVLRQLDKVKAQNKRYREAIGKSIAHFNQDEHQEGMTCLRKALEVTK